MSILPPFYRTEKKWMFVWRIWIKREKKLAHGIKRLATPDLATTKQTMPNNFI